MFSCWTHPHTLIYTQDPFNKNNPWLHERHDDETKDFCWQQEPFALVLIWQEPSVAKTNPILDYKFTIFACMTSDLWLIDKATLKVVWLYTTVLVV